MSYGILSKLRDEDNPGEAPVAKAKADLDKRLARAFKKWDSVKEDVKSGGFEEFDDGRYRARLIKSEIGVSGNDRLQVLMHWKFLTGEYKGKVKIAYQGIETEENLTYFGRDLQRFGYETDDIEGPDDIKGILKELNKEKPKAKISLKTKGDFQNVNILAVDGQDDDEAADDEDGDEEEEKPKKKKSKKSDDDESEEEESEEEESEDEEEEEEKPKKKSKKKAADEKEEEEEEEEEEEDDKPKKKNKKSSDDDEEEEEESEEEDEDGEDVEVAVGSKITYKFKGKKYEGVVLDIFAKSNEVRVETDEKKRKISFDNVLDVEVPEKPKKKLKKKK